LNSLRQSLGLNEVTIKGVPSTTHFAHVLTEADYRMKLIGIGLEAPPVPMKSYADRLTAAIAMSNSLIRWYFVPDYETATISDDKLSMHLGGQGVKLIGEDELVSADGTRSATGKTANAASRGFTNDFTTKFEQIATNHAVYGQLRNLVDLSIAAAFIQQEGFYEKAQWDLGVFGDEARFSVETLSVPRTVETAVNAVMRGSRLITPIGGGVAIQAKKAFEAENVKPDTNHELANLHEEIHMKGLANNQWWWD
ncbi:MAG: DUF1598 domain-containing protein, partial [Planctomycetales bacterium]|nr:DUF1598 domain-containing protein [Planctomycetales bacterium]